MLVDYRLPQGFRSFHTIYEIHQHKIEPSPVAALSSPSQDRLPICPKPCGSHGRVANPSYGNWRGGEPCAARTEPCRLQSAQGQPARRGERRSPTEGEAANHLAPVGADTLRCAQDDSAEVTLNGLMALRENLNASPRNLHLSFTGFWHTEGGNRHLGENPSNGLCHELC